MNNKEDKKENNKMIRLYELEIEKENPYGEDPEKDFEVLKDHCIKYLKNPDLDLISKAYFYMVEECKNSYRKSGSKYYTHPLKVAIILMKEIGIADNYSVCAALLHDLVEDFNHITVDMIREKFNDEIAFLVDGLTKIKGELTRKLGKAETYAKLFTSLIKDVRVIIVKIADRLDNMRTLQYMSRDQQKEIADETLNFYTPFAQRLGLKKIRSLLEELSLYYKDPIIYKLIKLSLDEKRKEFQEYIANFIETLHKKLNQGSIRHVVFPEHKHVYEIYKISDKGNIKLSQIENFFSIVVSLETNDYTECYRSYGIIANFFGPAIYFEDYIAKPKINFYRALHSIHHGPERKKVEVIIRTEEMDKIAEDGIGSLYKIVDVQESLKLTPEDIEKWQKWMIDVVKMNEDEGIQKIWGSIRMNLYEENISVFTTDKKEYILPDGSCIVDLAFNVSEETGYHIVSAKVNGEVKNLMYELKSNDIVEIITSPNAAPQYEWLDFVISHKAIVALHDYFKIETETGIYYQKKVEEFVKIKVIGDDRPGMLYEISQAIGQINVHRINLSQSGNSLFEGIIVVKVRDKSIVNKLFSNLMFIKGIKEVLIIEGEE
ncbi:MAG: HD domain-containing protein [Candidatus Kapabacteria bacterium]|nr:HD domain-containing protein [Candidatus Kapabacteria bacterium]